MNQQHVYRILFFLILPNCLLSSIMARDSDIEDPPGAINPYEVLEVEEKATADAIKSAYRKKALRHHPGMLQPYPTTIPKTKNLTTNRQSTPRSKRIRQRNLPTNSLRLRHPLRPPTTPPLRHNRQHSRNARS